MKKHRNFSWVYGYCAMCHKWPMIKAKDKKGKEERCRLCGKGMVEWYLFDFYEVEGCLSIFDRWRVSSD